MTPEETALAAEVAALPGFAWVPGMVDLPLPGFEPFRICDAATDDRWNPPAQVVSRGNGFTLATNLGPPDLHDPATAGCLLGMLWATDPDAGWHVHGPPGLYCVHRADATGECYGDHLGVAVARALVAIGRCA